MKRYCKCGCVTVVRRASTKVNFPLGCMRKVLVYFCNAFRTIQNPFPIPVSFFSTPSCRLYIGWVGIDLYPIFFKTYFVPIIINIVPAAYPLFPLFRKIFQSMVIIVITIQVRILLKTTEGYKWKCKKTVIYTGYN